MIVGFLDAKAFNGDRNYYPYAFQKFGLQIHQTNCERRIIPLRNAAIEWHQCLQGSLGLLQICASQWG